MVLLPDPFIEGARPSCHVMATNKNDNLRPAERFARAERAKSARTQSLRVVCPACHVAPWKPCRTVVGLKFHNERSTVHSARVFALGHRRYKSNRGSERLQCSRCRRVRSASLFRWQNRSKGRRHPQCRDCAKHSNARDRQRNRASYRDAKKTSQRELREIVKKAKDVPCIDCGKTYPPYVMDFDHRRGVKVAKVSALVYANSVRLLLEEIEKCDVVCANCHRERTFGKKVKP